MEKASIEELKRMCDGVIRLETTMDDNGGKKAFLYSAEINFPSRANDEELSKGLAKLVNEMMGDNWYCFEAGLIDFGFRDDIKYEIINEDERGPVLKLELHPWKFISDSTIEEDDDGVRYVLDCAIYTKDKDIDYRDILCERIAEFVNEHGNVKAPKREPKPEPFVPYEGKEIDIEAEVAKIDIEKLKEIEINMEGTRFGDIKREHRPLGMGIYLADTGRLRPDNALMAMTYEGNGLFTIIGHWEDVDTDPRNTLIARNSRRRNREYIQIDYGQLTGLNIGDGVDKDVRNAIAAYAMMSRFIQDNAKFCPFEIAESGSEHIKKMFPQKLLDYDQPDEQIKERLVEYLRE